MLPKKARASTKKVEEIFKKGVFLNSQNLTFKFIKTEGRSLARISFIAPKSVAKLAVKRNSLRRRGYNALKNFIHQFPKGLMGVFVYKKAVENISILENEIKNILIKVN